ncbi:MAG: shikimate dehydrogenase [Chitinophagaceae bacterium]|nr:shikimate dehydrogenase [Chitinophagaceae bacterium]
MRLYGLLGYPLTHSFSKNYFAKKFALASIQDARYENFSFDTVDDLETKLFQKDNLCGFNITIPYKKAILPFLHEQTEPVREMGACNCLHIKNGKRIGYNTDIIGFAHSLKPYIHQHHTHALILGTGGAAAAVEYVLRKAGIHFQFVSRTKKQGALTYKELDESIMQQHLLIINTSPVGQYPNIHEAPDLPYQYIGARHHLFDLIYNPIETRFLQLGREQGASIQNGQEMLVIQAEESWRIWNS